MLRTSDLEYDLPADRIATVPAQPRDSARLMVVGRGDGQIRAHARVRDLPGFLDSGDLLVLNTTRVIPARFDGVRVDSGGKAQGLYLAPMPGEPRRWTIYLKARRQSPGVEIDVTHEGHPTGVRLSLEQRSTDEPGAWVARVAGVGADESDEQVLGRIGLTPLPPYLLQARKAGGVVVPDEADRARYQTVFAQEAGASVAAPTAGLHLTPELLESLGRKGIARADVSLTVGSGTFKPVEAEYVESHPIHAEWCAMPEATRRLIESTRGGEGRGGVPRGRVVCVGTTAVRTVETFAALHATENPAPASVDTRLLITPGYAWRWTDAMLTNFHLPRSSLMAMVGAFLGGEGEGVERLKALYASAVGEGYRFYSYGDAMLIVP